MCPHYDFCDLDNDNEPVELWFSMNDAPRVGERIQHEGRWLERVISAPQEGVVEKDFKFKCWQVSGDEAKGAKHYDSDGCPVFSSKKEIRQFLRAQHEMGNTSASYGDGWSNVKP